MGGGVDWRRAREASAGARRGDGGCDGRGPGDPSLRGSPLFPPPDSAPAHRDGFAASAPSPSLPLVPAIVQAIDALNACHADHPVAKWWGKCDPEKAALDRCFREEKKLRRTASFEKARGERERLKARLAEGKGHVPGFGVYYGGDQAPFPKEAGGDDAGK